MNKKLAKKKHIFLAFWIFRKQLDRIKWKKTDVGLRKNGKGSGWAGNSWWKNTVHIPCWAKSPSLGQLGPVWPGPVQLSPQGTWMLLGAADVWQMAGWCAVKFQLFFFLLVKFQQQHDCIISSTYMAEQGSVFSKVSWEFVFVPFLFDFFFFIKEQSQTYPGDVFGETNLKQKTTTLRTENWSQFKRLASGTPRVSGTCYIIVIL